MPLCPPALTYTGRSLGIVLILHLTIFLANVSIYRYFPLRLLSCLKEENREQLFIYGMFDVRQTLRFDLS